MLKNTICQLTNPPNNKIVQNSVSLRHIMYNKLIILRMLFLHRLVFAEIILCELFFINLYCILIVFFSRNTQVTTTKINSCKPIKVSPFVEINPHKIQ